MSELRDFVADLLERRGAAVEALGPDRLEVLTPAPLRQQLGWPELTHLGFGAQQAAGTVAIALEGDWLDRFGALLADEGRWSERELRLPAPAPPPSDPERLLDRVLDLPNATWRLQGMSATWTRCLMLMFRLTALSDEKREQLIWLGFNLGTGAVINEILAQLRPALAQVDDWHMPDTATRRAAGPGWSSAALTARLRPVLEREARDVMEPFLRTMRRRLERDRDRVHAYHNDLREASLNRLLALDRASGDRAAADRRRETLRVEAIEREYRAKLDDLRRNYALRVTVEWVQALEIYVPVQRLEVLIRRRKGERIIPLDWHPLARMIERPLCEAGAGLDRVRLVCDDRLHLTDPAGHAPCTSCGKLFCRACFPNSCPRCHQTR
ncbi:hypothetical protein [Bradyrhizobium sp.]|uniref:hypothetical protein n=1 Tax=Bradyrhizobium sp. TaxID=376 RepID=UPI001ED7BFA0|nr:hypothetical protein [Bradyrhizobium sp.]MBV8922160.1 hypothetical protein [Bradyrhizobium sp.]MBV9979954.1 hypothetical protein [Bradyrhizobium sp.]